MTANFVLDVVLVFLQIITEAELMCLSTIHHWVGRG